MDRYLDYITNRALPRMPSGPDIQRALEALWSASAIAGTERTARMFQDACTGGACDIPLSLGEGLDSLKKYVFQIAIKDFLDTYTFNVKQVMKCCVAVLVPDGRAIPFCAYNSVGYREAVRDSLTMKRNGGRRGAS